MKIFLMITITKDWVGTKYVDVVMRTQVNLRDPEDIAAANNLQEHLKLTQKERGSYDPTNKWDKKEVLAMRAKYMKVGDMWEGPELKPLK